MPSQEPQGVPTFADHLTVKGAAGLLGVSPGTLRNWDESGKLRAKRHPINGYRLYERRDLERLLGELERGAARGSPAAKPGRGSGRRREREGR